MCQEFPFFLIFLCMLEDHGTSTFLTIPTCTHVIVAIVSELFGTCKSTY